MSERTKLVAGNWKMNLTATQAAATLETFAKAVSSRSDVDIVVCPSYLAIPKVRELLRSRPIHLGAQDVFWEDSGAFTGKVSAAMLADAGVDYCIVGHSETRGRFGKVETPASTLGYFAESDETVNLKIGRLLYHGINPILCVGETLAEREQGVTDAVIEAQIRAGLAGFDASELYFSAIAYEPCGASETGQTCEPAEASRICGLIRNSLASLLDEDVADQVRILYGGSVKATNSADLFHQPDIDGGLIGGASLDPQEFARIVMSAG